MVSQRCYDEIKEKVKHYTGEESFPIIWPAVKKAIELGNGPAREEILGAWLDVECCRICSECGAIMEEGWYLDACGYACSDECAMKIMGVPYMEHFRRYRIYKYDVDEWLNAEGKGRKEENLTQDEIDEIIGHVSDHIDACYTTWY